MEIYLYQIKCNTPDHYYVGITTRPEIREEEHRSGGERCAKWVKLHGVNEFTILDRFETKEEALKAERARMLQLKHAGYAVVSNGRFAKDGQKTRKKLKKFPKRQRYGRSVTVEYLKSAVLPTVYR